MLIISFILEPLLNASTTILYLSYYLFINKKKNTLIYFIFMGILFDIVYTNTLFINTITYIIIGILLKYFSKNVKCNKINITIICFINIFLSRLLSYFLLIIYEYNKFNLSILLSGIKKNILFSIIYYVILLLLLYRSKKLKTKYIV